MSCRDELGDFPNIPHSKIGCTGVLEVTDLWVTLIPQPERQRGLGWSLLNHESSPPRVELLFLLCRIWRTEAWKPSIYLWKKEFLPVLKAVLFQHQVFQYYWNYPSGFSTLSICWSGFCITGIPGVGHLKNKAKSFGSNWTVQMNPMEMEHVVRQENSIIFPLSVRMGQGKAPGWPRPPRDEGT